MNSYTGLFVENDSWLYGWAKGLDWTARWMPGSGRLDVNG